MFNIVSTSQKSCNRIFDGWENVPTEYRTRAAWKRAFRTVQKGEKTAAEVFTTITRTLTSTEEKAQYNIEKSYQLYHISQTQPLRQTPLNIAQHEFYDAFARFASRQKLIRWTQGQWQNDDDQRYWGRHSRHLGVANLFAVSGA